MSTVSTRLFYALISLIFSVTFAARAATYDHAKLGLYENMPSPTYNVYSYSSTPATPGLAYGGGWATPADIGDDKLYSFPVGTTTPTPLHWTQPSDYKGGHYADGSVPGYHVNDPTIVAPHGAERALWRYLYFTCLPSAYTTAPAYFQYNHVCWATSIDGGQSWTFLGELIGQNNGIDTRGAWSPVAILIDDAAHGPHIALFYHTNSYDLYGNNVGTAVHRKDLDSNGWSNLDDQIMYDTSTGAPLDASNVFITTQDDQYLMFANGGAAVGFNVIVAYTSTDLIHWTPWAGAKGATFIGGGNFHVYTPEWYPTGPGEGILSFSYDAAGDMCPNGWAVCKYGALFSYSLIK